MINVSNQKTILLLKIPYCPHPDSCDDKNFRTEQPFYPVPSLGLAALYAFLEKHNHNNYKLCAIDINIEAYNELNAPIDITKYIPLLDDAIKQSQYDILAISAMFIFNARWVDYAVKLSIKYHPNAKIIIGGGYPTLFPEKCLTEYEIDACVIGEGEATLLHLINKFYNFADLLFEEKFPFDGYGIKTKEGELILSLKKEKFLNLEDLPIPAWNALNIERYFKGTGIRSLPIEASRGCPYRCVYCCVHVSWGRKVRYHPVEQFINEILLLKKVYNLTNIHFIDDNLTFSKEWIVELLSRLIELGSPIKFTVSNFSVKHLDNEIIDLFLKAGITGFTLAIETGSLEIQKKVGKNIDLDKAVKIAKEIQSRGAQIHLCWMVGFPHETISQINETFNFARKMRAESNQFLTVVPYPGTELFEKAKNDDLLFFTDNYLDRYDMRRCDYIKSDEWNYKQLQDMIYDVNIELNFLNTPLLETTAGKKAMISQMKNLIIRLPDHVIAHIVLGFLLKHESQFTESKQHYDTAIRLLENKKLSDVFSKYINVNNSIMNDFRQNARKQTDNTSL